MRSLTLSIYCSIISVTLESVCNLQHRSINLARELSLKGLTKACQYSRVVDLPIKFFKKDSLIVWNKFNSSLYFSAYTTKYSWYFL